MNITRLNRAALACAAAFIGVAVPAHATTFALGTITAPKSVPIEDSGLLGPFTDVFTFSIGAGDTFGFSSFAETGFARRYSIPDMQGYLFADDHLLATGDARTIFMPEGWPSREVRFAPLVLGAGDYQLKFTGTGTSAIPGSPIYSAYYGTVDFAAAPAPVPEPQTFMLMALGLGVLGLLARRREASRRG